MSFFDTLKNTFNELKAGSTNLLDKDNQEGTVAGPFGMPQRAPITIPNYDEMVVRGKQTFDKVAGGTNEFAKSIVKGIAQVGLDVGEAPLRAGGIVASLAGNDDGADITQTVVPPRELPGILGKWLGPMQSYSSQIAQAQKEEKPITGAVVDFALNEPAGIALKPLFLGVGMVAKQFFSKGGEKVIDDIARSTNKDDISRMLPDNIPDKEELANKLVTAKDKGAVEKIIDDHVITRDPSLVKDGSPSASQIDAIVQDYRNTGKVNEGKTQVYKGVEYTRLSNNISEADMAIDKDGVGWITNLFTKEEHRGKGGATNIIINALNRLSQKGVKEIRVVPESVESRKLFENFGFENKGREMILSSDKINDYRQTGKVLDKGQDLSSPRIGEEAPMQLPRFLTEESSTYNKQLYKQSDSPSILDTARETGDNPSVVSKVAESIRNAKLSLTEVLQDEAVRVKNLVESAGANVDDASNIYQKMTLYSGKVGKLIEEGKSSAEDIIKSSKSLADDVKSSLDDVRKEVNDYLVARHAPERNAALGDGAAGITTKEAIERTKAIESSPNGKKVVEIANKVQDLNNKTLDMLRDSGVITDDLYRSLREKYKTHVPLQRVMEFEDDIGSVLSGKGYDVKSTGIKKAKGSQREVADVLANVVSNYEQAVLRSQKNIVDNATLQFVKNNKDILGDNITITKPKIIGKTSKGSPIMENTNDPRILQMYVDGKKVWIKIKDENLAIALRGIGREKIPKYFTGVAAFTRFYAGLATRFNPEFVLPNKIRDLQETMTYLAAQKDIGFKGAAGVVKQDFSSYKDVLDGLRGKDTAGAKLYKEMQELGGTTGGMGLSTRKQVELSIEKLEKLANSKTRQSVENFIQYIDDFNTIFEDSTRLSVYKQALEQGASKERAAFLAKEASINFNRMGKAGPWVNAAYMFSNASIQGSVKMIRALKNPKVLGSVMLAVGGATAAMNEWNDRVDPDWRNKVTKYDRLNSMPVLLPSKDGGVHYFTIPVSWGIKPIKVMSDYAYDAISGQGFESKNFVNDIFTSIANAYNPMGGTDWLSAITPTILDTPVDIERNVSWSGSKIRPEGNNNAPRDIQYFSNLGDTKTGAVSINISKVLHDKADISISPADIKYAIEQYSGGSGRFVGKLFNVGANLNSDKPLPAKEYPFLSRFYRTRTEEEVGQGAGGDIAELKKTLGEQERARFETKQKAQNLYNEWKKLPKEEANAKAAELKKTDPITFSKLKDIATQEKRDLNYRERLMGQLGVENGERARYILNEAMKLETNAEKNAYIKDLQEKGLVSTTVLAQLRKLAKQQKTP